MTAADGIFIFHGARCHSPQGTVFPLTLGNTFSLLSKFSLAVQHDSCIPSMAPLHRLSRVHLNSPATSCFTHWYHQMPCFMPHLAITRRIFNIRLCDGASKKVDRLCCFVSGFFSLFVRVPSQRASTPGKRWAENESTDHASIHGKLVRTRLG